MSTQLIKPNYLIIVIHVVLLKGGREDDERESPEPKASGSKVPENNISYLIKGLLTLIRNQRLWSYIIKAWPCNRKEIM